MPNAFRVLKACREHPFLAMSLELDRSLTGQMVKDMADAAPPPARPDSGVSLGTSSPELLDAFLRLARLLDTPERIPILAPLVIREIHYLLLIGPQGAGLRQLNTHGTQANSIARATDWLRKNYRTPPAGEPAGPPGQYGDIDLPPAFQGGHGHEPAAVPQTAAPV